MKYWDQPWLGHDGGQIRIFCVSRLTLAGSKEQPQISSICATSSVHFWLFSLPFDNKDVYNDASVIFIAFTWSQSMLRDNRSQNRSIETNWFYIIIINLICSSSFNISSNFMNDGRNSHLWIWTRILKMQQKSNIGSNASVGSNASFSRTMFYLRNMFNCSCTLHWSESSFFC